MIGQLIVGSVLMLLSIMVFAGFMALGSRFAMRHGAWLLRPPQFLKIACALCAMSLWLILGMVVIVWTWSSYFLWAGALGDLDTAVYFSLVAITTLGFGDIILAEQFRLLSGMLAATGLVLFGLTTAALIELIGRLHPASSKYASGDRD